MNHCPRADLRAAAHHDVRQQANAVAKVAVASNDAKRSDFHSRTQRRAVFDNRGSVHGHFSWRR
jgi:hypothetical protein